MTYETKSSWDSFSDYYTLVRESGILCEVITSYQPAVYNFSGLLHTTNDDKWYPAQLNSTDNRVYYFDYSSGKVISRSTAGSMTQVASGVTVTSQYPSGYLAALAEGQDVGFVLEEES